MTEGTIDPMLEPISFYNQDKRITAIHYYATAMSYYGDGLVSSDFVEIARKQLRKSNQTAIAFILPVQRVTSRKI